MGAMFHNDYRQQPITSDEARDAYRGFLGRWEETITDQEDKVIRARVAGDTAELADARTRLWRLLSKRQGLLDAIAAYERQRQAQPGAQQQGA
jgi:hypothetical protein